MEIKLQSKTEEPVQPVAFNLKGLEEATQLGRTKIYDLIEKGILRSRKHGGRRIFLADEVIEDLKSIPFDTSRVAKGES